MGLRPFQSHSADDSDIAENLSHFPSDIYTFIGMDERNSFIFKVFLPIMFHPVTTGSLSQESQTIIEKKPFINYRLCWDRGNKNISVSWLYFY